LIYRGQLLAAIEEPQDRQAAEECLAMLERTYPSRTPPVTQPMREDAEMMLLVAGWFRSHPEELERPVLPETAKEGLRTNCAGIRTP
jgi:hypothetical protein